jgi:hypothetical protein
VTILPALLYNVIGIAVPTPSPGLGLRCVLLVDLQDRYDMAEHDDPGNRLPNARGPGCNCVPSS